MRYGNFVDRDQNLIDEVMAVYMPKGKSYTGADQIEIFCHGGRKIVELIQSAIITSGARAAEPGEFTKMAFLAGRIDLAKAESVAEIISANTESSYQAAREHLSGAYTEHIGMLRDRLVDLMAEVEASIDYPEEEIEPEEKEKLLANTNLLMENIATLIDSYKGGRIITEGFKIAIAGRPNAGKSSLFNQFLRQERALVTPTAGTTRDYLSEWIDIEGYKVNIIDTAGLRDKGGAIEKVGIESAKNIIKSAHLVLWLVDISKKGWKTTVVKDLESLPNKHKIIIYNKIDAVKTSPKTTENEIGISCKTGHGIKELLNQIHRIINDTIPDQTDGIVVTSQRHQQKLSAALRCLKSAKGKIETNESPELTAFDLNEAISAIDEITGKIYNEEILGRIFSKFCIGK